MRDILAEKVSQAKKGDYYALLDLPEDAGDKDIKDAYFRLARLVHPDSIQKQSLQDRKDDAAFIFEKVTEAYQVLMDPRRKQAYLDARGTANPALAVEQNNKMQGEAAKISLHQGKMLLNRRAYSEAEVHFKKFTELKPEDARGYLFLGWCLFQNQDRPLMVRLEEARASFNRALKLDENSADAHYYLALYHKQKGDHDAMAKHLKKALGINKDHVPARREQRLVEMRGNLKPDQPTIGSYLKGVFGKLKKKD